MRRVLRTLAALALFVPLAGQAAASCDINLTLSVPRWYPTSNFPVDIDNQVMPIEPGFSVELETQRRTGGWEPAILTLPPGSRDIRLLSPENDNRTWRYPGGRLQYDSRYFRLRSGPHTLPEIIFLRAALQGAGCVADRQFRIRYRCGVRERMHVAAYGRPYVHRWQTDVLFGGNRVAPRDLRHTIRCPAAG